MGGVHRGQETGFSYLPLSWEISITCWDPKQEGVVRLEDGGVTEDGDVRRLGRGVHLAEDLVGERLLDPSFAKVLAAVCPRARHALPRDTLHGVGTERGTCSVRVRACVGSQQGCTARHPPVMRIRKTVPRGV